MDSNDGTPLTISQTQDAEAPLSLKVIVEAFLFTCAESVSLERLSRLCGQSPSLVRAAVDNLAQEYRGRETGLQIIRVAGGYRMVTRPELSGHLQRMDPPPTRPKLSGAALETLAIVAYRQPITRLEVEQFRGVKVDGVFNTLLARRLIRRNGRRDTPGRPATFGTTPQFLQAFGLDSLADLPPVEWGEPRPDHHPLSFGGLSSGALGSLGAGKNHDQGSAAGG
ncbi:MAG: SMC-Scp complex subunit ScpB [Firmicutes bacterium]|nr:SMC-Scp complex subunit ScpB [Bacillota bacterium]